MYYFNFLSTYWTVNSHWKHFEYTYKKKYEPFFFSANFKIIVYTDLVLNTTYIPLNSFLECRQHAQNQIITQKMPFSKNLTVKSAYFFKFHIGFLLNFFCLFFENLKFDFFLSFLPFFSKSQTISRCFLFCFQVQNNYPSFG